MPDNKDVQTAMASILQYLNTRPTAADTTEGVYKWWINWSSAAGENMQTTISALERLAANGQIESVKAGNRIIWRKKR